MTLVPSGSDRRVALLVDGDNLSPALAGPILKRGEQLGRVDVRRVYAAAAGFRAWEDVPGFRPVRVGGAKNGTDLVLCIDAVEMACGGRFEAFVLASDDRDFGHLAHWLRERGVHVLGLGTGKAVAGWRASCSEFGVLTEAKPPGMPPIIVSPPSTAPITSAAPKSVPAKKATNGQGIDEKIRQLIITEGVGGAIDIGKLGGRMGSVHHMTLEKLGLSNWRTYLAARPQFYALDRKGVTARVRWIGS